MVNALEMKSWSMMLESQVGGRPPDSVDKSVTSFFSVICFAPAANMTASL